MDDTTSFMDTAVASPTYTYTDPISSFFGGIFTIIILFLIVVLVVVLLIGRGLGFFKDAAPAAPPKKEGFKDGPPYPHCKTNGSFAMF